MTGASAIPLRGLSPGPRTSFRRRQEPSAVSRLRAALKLALAQAGPFGRAIRVSIITDPALEKRHTTLLNTGAEISFNRHFLRQVADGSRRLHDILVIELARAATIALGKRARMLPSGASASTLEESPAANAADALSPA